MRRIIAIGGPHGSGKSSVAKDLAEELKMAYVSAGEVFRQIAKERNLTLAQLSQIAETEVAIDKLIDERTKELGKIENTVVDAQLASYFTPDDIALKMSITASFETRCARIAKRDYISLEEAIQETKVREKTEAQRFIDLYNIDVRDNSIYDIVLNNDRMDKQRTYHMTKEIVKAALDF